MNYINRESHQFGVHINYINRNNINHINWESHKLYKSGNIMM